MVFTSYQFLIFFPVIATAYFLVSHRWRWILLLGASYYFYMAWRPEYAILLILTTTIDWLAAIGISATHRPIYKRLLLTASLVSNLSVLISFKYFNFLNDSVAAVFA